MRVIIVDDDALTRVAIKQYLRPPSSYRVVAEAGNGQEAISAVSRHEADVVLMDLGMPVMDGIEATRQICSQARHPHVVALTTWDVDNAVVRVIEAGAVGYLLKYSAPQELDSALRRVAAGESVLSPGALAELLRHVRSQKQASGALAPAAPPASVPSMPPGAAPMWGPPPGGGASGVQHVGADLTKRELEVVAAAAEGLTNDQIAEKLYVSASTVKAHLHSAQERLGARNRTHLAIIAERAGLLL